MLRIIAQNCARIAPYNCAVLKYLGVVLHEGHLHVEPHELGHVAVGERVLGAEDGAHLEDALEVAHQSHLLVQLRRLREVREAVKVLDLEDVGATLGGGCDELRRVDFCKPLGT